MSFVLLEGDCRVSMQLCLGDSEVDAIVTDPPYGLGFMGKKWDTPGALVERKSDTSQKWDHVGGNHNPSNSADQVRTRLVEGRKFQQFSEEWARECLRVLKPGGHLLAFSGTRTYHRMVCAIEDAGFEIRDQLQWIYGSGFPKSHNGEWGGTALKPAHEPIVLARKPLIGTVEANWLAYGTGALNIDGSRVGMGEGESNPSIARYASTQQQGNNGWSHVNRGAKFDAAAAESASLGRWPANIMHDGSDEVIAAFPDSTARFFYCAKASKKDRGADNTHPTVKPTELMRYLCRLVTPPGGTVLDPFMGSGSTGKAAMLEGFRFIGCEMDEAYLAVARARIEAARGLA